MFPSRLPILPALQLLVCAAITLFGLALTSNPLFVLVMLFSWHAPPFVERPAPASANDDEEDDESGMGFLAGDAHAEGDSVD